MTHYKGCVLSFNNGFRNATNSNFYRIPLDPDAPFIIIIIMPSLARITLSALIFCHDFAVLPNNPLSFYSNKSDQSLPWVPETFLARFPVSV